MGYTLFQKIIEEKGFEEAMTIREVHNDITFLRFYTDEDFMREHNYFSHSYNKKQQSSIVDDISDDEGWEGVRDAMITNVGLNRIPVVYVDNVEKNNTVISHTRTRRKRFRNELCAQSISTH